ncbi:MAG: FecR family protein [Flavobacteriales bacterium]
MEKYDEHIDTLIARMLSGEATDGDVAIVEMWRGLHADNDAYFIQMQNLSQKVDVWQTELQFDTAAAWRKVQSKISFGEATNKVVQLKPKADNNWWRMAATVAVLLGFAAVWWWQSAGTRAETYSLSATDTIVKDTLADGTQTVLNKNASLTYSYNTQEKKREVHLTGEAYFNVAKDPQTTFEIHAGDLIIQDIGTAFNVRHAGDTVTVSVDEGVVKMYNFGSEGLVIQAGEMGYYLKQTGNYVKAEQGADTENESSYATGKFRFRNARLERVVRKLNEAYNNELQILTPELNNCRISVTFDGQDIRTIAGILAESLGAELVEENGKLLLKGPGC